MKLLELAFEAAGNVLLHKARSLLAVLGIVFGVASVICMLSISEVARRDVAQRIERMGINNIILDTVKPEEVRGSKKERNGSSSQFRYGIRRTDLKTLTENVAAIRDVVPMTERLSEVYANQKHVSSSVVGTTSNYAKIMNHRVRVGRFLNPVDDVNLSPVCVLGYETARKLYPLTQPIGNVVRIRGLYFKVVGVMEQKGKTGTIGNLADPDASVFLPFETAYSKFEIGHDAAAQGMSVRSNDVEIGRAVLRVDSPELLKPVSLIADSFLSRIHKQKDFSVTIPHALLKEQQQSEKIFRWVMGSLAAISLLVGGIGIMNIMLANTTERKSEIGLRRALGARRRDIISLFVSESLLLCVFGGAMGVAVGFGLAQIIGSLAEWTVVYHSFSIPLGIFVSAAVGILFGTVPAIRAAQQDPVIALRAV